MKNSNKIMLLLLSVLLPMGFTGCSDDDEIPAVDNSTELEIGVESLRVKVGDENKTTLNIKQGNGEYNAFALDTAIAKAYVENEQIVVEGISNGATLIVVSDKGGFYRKVPVSIYTTDVLTLEKSEVALITKLGHVGTFETHVVLGNGGYTVKSDNPAVSAIITEEGEITISAKSKPEAFTAILTVTDCTNLSATVEVSVKSTTTAFTEEELINIKADGTRRYYLDGKSDSYISWGTAINSEDESGVVKYGWDYYNYYFYKLTFKGGKTVGKKTEGLFNAKGNLGTYNESIALEVIQNDGTNVWGIFTFTKDEVLHYGYFCDKK